MNFKGAMLLLALFSSNHVAAHEDLDIGIESVVLDKKCRAQIVLKNYGRELPDSFYMTVRPAYLTVEKGFVSEELKSLRLLDKKRALKPTGGTLQISSRKTFAKNPKPISLQMQVEGEFLDYGAANNQHTESMDCVIGKGQIIGEAIPDTQPDIVVETARIDPESCRFEVSFTNRSSIGLDGSAWHPREGAFLMQMSLPAHERQPDIALHELDPQRAFTRKLPKLRFVGSLSAVDAEVWRVGLWQVLNEKYFADNQIDIAVPEKCRATRAHETIP